MGDLLGCCLGSTARLAVPPAVTSLGCASWVGPHGSRSRGRSWVDRSICRPAAVRGSTAPFAVRFAAHGRGAGDGVRGGVAVLGPEGGVGEMPRRLRGLGRGEILVAVRLGSGRDRG